MYILSYNPSYSIKLHQILETLLPSLSLQTFLLGQHLLRHPATEGALQPPISEQLIQHCEHWGAPSFPHIPHSTFWHFPCLCIICKSIFYFLLVFSPLYLQLIPKNTLSRHNFLSKAYHTYVSDEHNDED